jgi:hypothetical protein
MNELMIGEGNWGAKSSAFITKNRQNPGKYFQILAKKQYKTLLFHILVFHDLFDLLSISECEKVSGKLKVYIRYLKLVGIGRNFYQK